MVFSGEEAEFPTEIRPDCFSKLAWAFPENIQALEQAVNNIMASAGKSVFSKAFRKAFEYFQKSPTAEYRGITIHKSALILEIYVHINIIMDRFCRMK